MYMGYAQCLPSLPTHIRATDKPLFLPNPKQCFNVAPIDRSVGRASTKHHCLEGVRAFHNHPPPKLLSNSHWAKVVLAPASLLVVSSAVAASLVVEVSSAVAASLDYLVAYLSVYSPSAAFLQVTS